jgi:ABC-type multidrug transport system ATPase subunit
MKPYFGNDDAVKKIVEQMDEEHYQVSKVMAGLGLTRVKDTFVGDQTTVRGVSGGEKKRVTVAEMSTIGVPVICCDEISTGLDGEFIQLRLYWVDPCLISFSFSPLFSCHYL